MKSLLNIGLSNVVPDQTEILHSTLFGRKNFGRTADLLCAYVENRHQLGAAVTGNLRFLIGSLLEAAPRSARSSSRVEMALVGSQVLLSVRSECSLEVPEGDAERVFTRYWLDSEEMRLLKRSILPHDRIEVRYQKQNRMVEWRVSRELGDAHSQEVTEGFVVYSDPRDSLTPGSANFKDLGDLPYSKWLQEVYRGASRESSTGEIKVEGGTQSEIDLVRMKLEAELSSAEESAIDGGDSEQLDQSVTRVEGGEPREGSFEWMARRLQSGGPEMEDLLHKMNILKFEDQKRREDLQKLKKRMTSAEALLQKKELELYRRETELKELKMKGSAGSGGSGAAGGGNPFREKALQMYSKLKELSLANEALERKIFLLRNRRGDEELESQVDQSFGLGRAQEDADKRIERLQRALDSEKAKVKGLLDRALAAEKEAQSVAPVVSDLEARLEFVTKTSLQHKKDVEMMKQKLVQAEGEKNKVQNELIAAKAQNETLKKRAA